MRVMAMDAHMRVMHVSMRVMHVHLMMMHVTIDRRGRARSEGVSLGDGPSALLFHEFTEVDHVILCERQIMIHRQILRLAFFDLLFEPTLVVESVSRVAVLLRDALPIELGADAYRRSIVNEVCILRSFGQLDTDVVVVDAAAVRIRALFLLAQHHVRVLFEHLHRLLEEYGTGDFLFLVCSVMLQAARSKGNLVLALAHRSHGEAARSRNALDWLGRCSVIHVVRDPHAMR